MVEHSDTPSAPDDDLPAGAFDALGLGSLADDVHPTRAGWVAIDEAAGRRHAGRRPWFVSAAAVVVLVLAVTGLVMARSGREEPDVVAGSGSAAAPWALPPEGAEVTSILDPGDQWVLQFVVGGELYTLNQRIDQIGVTGTTTVGDAIESNLGVVLGTRVTVPGIGSAYLMCSGLRSSGTNPDGTLIGPVPTGPSAVAWTAPGWAYHLSGQPTSLEPGRCGAEDPDPSAILDLASSLRFVDDAGKAAFLEAHGDVAQEMQGIAGPATTVTTAPEDPPADRGSAEEQIATAVADWKVQAADGSYPHLEDGAAKAAEYTERFATAARQSGADQASDGSGNRNTLTSVRFVTPERATLDMSMTAVLPSGTFTFQRPGEAILQDGRWVVTYRTVVDILGQACTPPGGYDGCATN